MAVDFLLSSDWRRYGELIFELKMTTQISQKKHDGDRNVWTDGGIQTHEGGADNQRIQ